jgi:hypothetical protein
MSPFVSSQGNASSRNISRAGAKDFGSSSVPMLNIIAPGAFATSSAIDDPHSGQKCRTTGLPLPPGAVNVFMLPVTVTVSFGTTIKAPNALPVNFWQSRQWHTTDIIGFAVVA